MRAIIWMPKAQKKVGLKLDESIRSPAGYVLINWVCVCAMTACGCLRHSFFVLASLMEEHWKHGWFTFGYWCFRIEDVVVVCCVESVSEPAEAETQTVTAKDAAARVRDVVHESQHRAILASIAVGRQTAVMSCHLCNG